MDHGLKGINCTSAKLKIDLGDLLCLKANKQSKSAKKNCFCLTLLGKY